MACAVSVPGIGYAENVTGCCCACARLKVVAPPMAMVAPSARVSFRMLAGKPPALEKLRIVRALFAAGRGYPRAPPPRAPMSLTISFGRHKFRIGTNHTALAQSGPKRGEP